MDANSGLISMDWSLLAMSLLMSANGAEVGTSSLLLQHVDASNPMATLVMTSPILEINYDHFY